MRLVILLALGVAACAQTKTFDVASVKFRPGSVDATDIRISGSGIRVAGRTVRGLVVFAYDLRNDQVILEEKSEVGDNLYEIVARADHAASADEFKEMMRNLLADRFALKVHREARERPVYYLLVDKNGPKLTPAEADAGAVSHIGVNGRNSTVNIKGGTIALFIEALGGFLDRPVIDHTMLNKSYDIQFEATPMYRMNRDQEFADLSPITAVQKLGLKLEPHKDPIEVLVVDQVSKPTEN